METEIFVQLVLEALPSFGLDGSSQLDRERVMNGIRALHASGFSLTDAIEYAKCWEEVDPTMREEVALKRMSEIRARYGKIIL